MFVCRVLFVLFSSCRGSDYVYIARTPARIWPINIHEIFYLIKELLAAGVATALKTPNYKVNRLHVTRVKPAEESLQIYPLTSLPPSTLESD